MSASPRTANPQKKSLAAVLSAAVLLLPCAPAATLEQIYQRALEDSEFKSADEELNAAYSRGMRTLPREERDKLRQAERFWIRENQELLLQNPQREVEVLKQRFLKRRDELLQRDGAPTATPATSAALAPVASAPPAQPAQPEAGAPQGWNEKVAANLERVYQNALQDPAFETADSALRALFKETVSALNPAERSKLRPAQKAWVRENAVLISANPAHAQSILTERVLQRKAELARILEERRFLPAAASSQTPPPSPSPPRLSAQSLSPAEIPSPQPAPPPPANAETPPAPTEPKEPVLAHVEDKHGAGLSQLFWALLGIWILGLGFFHYRALTRKQKQNASSPAPALDVNSLYLATGTGFLVSLAPLLAAPSALTATVAVLFTVVGLGTAKIAAEEWTRPSPDTPQKNPETPRPQTATDTTPETAYVGAELQRTQQGNNRRGGRQKRRGK